MTAIKPEFLEKLGINLDSQTAAAFSEHVQETLHKRVSESIVLELDDDQLDEMNELSGNDEALQTWLSANVPNLDEIIREEIDILLGDLAES